MKKGRRIALAGLIAVFLLAALGVSYLLYSERALQWMAEVATRYAPGELSFGHIDGRLAGPIRIRELAYRTDDSEARIADLELDWSPWRLLDARIHLDRLRADDVHIVLPPPAPEAADRPQAPPPERDFGLPLAVVLEQAEARDIVVRRGAGAAPHVIDRLALSGGLAERLELDSLRLEAPVGQLEAGGWIDAAAPHRMAVTLSWKLTAAGSAPELRGTGSVNGDLRQLALVHEFTGAAEAELQAELRDLTAAPAWEADLRIARLSPQALDETWPALPTTGRIRGGGGIEQFRLDARLHVSGTPAGALDSRLELERDGASWQLRQALIQPANGPTRLHATGTLQLEQAPKLSVKGRWTDLQWPLSTDAAEAPPEARFASREGELTLQGWLDDFQLSAGAELAQAQRPLGRWEIAGRGDRDGFKLERLDARTLDGSLSGTGRVRWRPALDWELALSGSGLDPARFDPRWPGELALRLQHSGGIQDETLRTNTRLEQLTGDLRGYRLQGTAALQSEGERLRIEQMQLNQGPNRLSASGQIGDSWDLSWELEAADLQAAHPEAAGRLSGRGTLSGPRAAPDIEATLNGRKLAYADHRAGAVDARLALRRQEGAESSLSIEANTLVAQGRELGRLRIEGNGQVDRHRLEADWRAPEGRVRLTAQGGLEQTRWRGQLSQMELAKPEFGTWRLQDATEVVLSPERQSMSEGCWRSTKGAVCLAGSRSQAGSDVAVRLEALALSVLAGVLPESIQLAGTIEGTAEFHDTAARSELSAAFSLPPSRLTYAPEGAGVQSFAYRRGHLRLRTEAAGIHGDLALPLERLGSVQGRFALPGFWPGPFDPATQKVEAGLEAELRDLSLVAALVPDLEQTAGSLRMNLAARGSLAAPELDGDLVLRNGSARIPRLGIELTGTRLTLRTAPNGTLQVEGQTSSGGGRLALDGRIGLDVLRGGRAELQISGRDFEVSRLPEAQIFASPELDVGITGRTVRVTGEVRVPRAEIRAGQYRAPVPVSEDVILTNGQQAPSEPEPLPTWRIASQVTVVLGDKVNFQGFGLTARIAGSLTAIDQPEKGTLGEGELRVLDGKYKIYGRELQIEQGRLLFAGGPIANPGIDARAVRQVREVRAGVRVYGDLQDPRVSLFSEPPMDDSDILSYIVVGRPLNTASEAEGEALYQAARQLGLAGGGLLARRLEETFGFDELRIQPLTETSEDPALVIGKYLSPRLYVSYAIGLFQDANILQLQYEIDKNWRLQTETGPRAGGDIIYSIER